MTYTSYEIHIAIMFHVRTTVLRTCTRMRIIEQGGVANVFLWRERSVFGRNVIIAADIVNNSRTDPCTLLSAFCCTAYRKTTFMRMLLHNKDVYAVVGERAQYRFYRRRTNYSRLC